jgi:hypothetical protein
MLPQNVGENDRAVRIVGGMLLLLYSAINLTGSTQMFVVVVSLAIMATGMVGSCMLYSLFGMNTCPAKPAKKSSKKTTVKKAVAVAKVPAKKTKRSKR